MAIKNDMAMQRRSARSSITQLGTQAAAAALLIFAAGASASACESLTPALITGNDQRFYLDDEGYAATPWNLQLEQVSASGGITGDMTTNVYGGTQYPVNGSVSGTGTLEISFSYNVGGIVELIGSGTTYSYTGAIDYADSACDVFIAGTYTSTYFTTEETRFGTFLVPHTSAPMPFSGLLLPIFY
jgi:hypothetical protein